MVDSLSFDQIGERFPAMNHPSSTSVGFEDDCPLFHDLSREEREQLASISRLKTLSPQQYLCRQNAPSDWVFNIASGTGLIERLSSTGRRQVLAFIFPGDFAGLNNSSQFEYGIKALTDMSAYEFPREKLYTLSEDLPHLKANMRSIGALVQALTFDQLYLLGQKKAHERLCFFCIHMLERMPGATPEGINLAMSRQDIADFLGMTVETVSRSMAKLKQDGIVATPAPQTIRILDLEQMQDLADIH
ncbi:Crp/Fnr family transcriptional regulator [Parahaliea maris]|uniref:Crp/Fnr family transcriptional regulator n=1 Tax=Parahaliea maris TaxID=2716870 RepID=UPI00164F1122|nr:Crp/Fnr family transcriptional regulator [Parahaliea maris]